MCLRLSSVWTWTVACIDYVKERNRLQSTCAATVNAQACKHGFGCSVCVFVCFFLLLLKLLSWTNQQYRRHTHMFVQIVKIKLKDQIGWHLSINYLIRSSILRTQISMVKRHYETNVSNYNAFAIGMLKWAQIKLHRKRVRATTKSNELRFSISVHHVCAFQNYLAKKWALLSRTFSIKAAVLLLLLLLYCKRYSRELVSCSRSSSLLCSNLLSCTFQTDPLNNMRTLTLLNLDI